MVEDAVLSCKIKETFMDIQLIYFNLSVSMGD